MIDRKRKIIFIHIPKTGGTSMENALNGTSCKLFTQHKTVAEYAASNNLNKFFKFTIIRNPWDKMVSEYFYYKQGGSPGFAKDEKFSKKWPNSFLKFVKGDFWPLKPHRPKHYCSQLSFLRIGNTGHIMDYICRFERLKEDVSYVSAKLGINLNLPYLRKSRHDDYVKYYDDEACRIVTEAYAEDIEYFGYKFGE